MDKDITKQVKISKSLSGEYLPLLKCVCGRKFGHTDFVLYDERNNYSECDCGRKLYFKIKRTVYEIID